MKPHAAEPGIKLVLIALLVVGLSIGAVVALVYNRTPNDSGRGGYYGPSGARGLYLPRPRTAPAAPTH